ncbi:MAG TPA: secretin N-terminal domain-containing protein [Candidatus Nitrosotalea sp.]|nr:secretin N-terminal domain-containing protein [Candidatus Nitrosotalea sp.]
MKTKPVILLIVGLGISCFVGLAQNNPGKSDPVPKQSSSTVGAAGPAEATAAAPEPAGEILPLVQFEDAPLVDVIKTLARQANLNVIFDPRVTAVGADGKTALPSVSIRLENVTAQNVLEAVLNNNNLRLDRDVKTKISRVTVKDPAAAEPLVSKVYQLKYSYPTNLVAVIKPTLGPRSQVIPDVRTSQLIVLATEKDMLEVDALIEKLDTATKQVLIEARMVETTKNPKTAKGINWEKTFASQNISFGNNQYLPQPADSLNPLVAATTPSLLIDTAAGFNPATAFLNADGVKAVFSWFNQDNNSDVIATPRAVTSDNHPATLSVARALPIFKVTQGGTQSGPTVDITYTNIGVSLVVTPRISANNNIGLSVIPEVSNVEDTKDIQTIGGFVNTANIYDIRKIETRVLIPSGNTLVMGGLISDNFTTQNTKVPILGDIPGVGLAFRSSSKSREKRNLIIFVTPTIVKDEDYQPTPTDFLKNKPPVDKANGPDPEFQSPLDSTTPYDWNKPVY